jgi:hypothetical protein
MHHCCARAISIVPPTTVQLGLKTFYPSPIVSFLGDRGSDIEADTIKSLVPTSTFWAKAQYYIPSLHWIPNYTLSLYAILNRSNPRV